MGNIGFRTFSLEAGSAALGLSKFQKTLAQQAETKRQMRIKTRNPGDRPATDHIFSLCGRNCHSQIGLSSHTKLCPRTTNQSTTP